MNILDTLAEKNLSNSCVTFIADDNLQDVIAIFYGEDPSAVWDAAIEFFNNQDFFEEEISVYRGAEKIGICVGDFNETTDTQYFEIE